MKKINTHCYCYKGIKFQQLPNGEYMVQFNIRTDGEEAMKQTIDQVNEIVNTCPCCGESNKDCGKTTENKTTEEK